MSDLDGIELGGRLSFTVLISFQVWYICFSVNVPVVKWLELLYYICSQFRHGFFTTRWYSTTWYLKCFTLVYLILYAKIRHVSFVSKLTPLSHCYIQKYDQPLNQWIPSLVLGPWTFFSGMERAMDLLSGLEVALDPSLEIKALSRIQKMIL